MFKKPYAAFVPLLAVMALALIPAAAQAEMKSTHWYSNGTLIKAGTKVAITSQSASLVQTDVNPASPLFGTKWTCVEDNKGFVENPIGGGAGIDSITSITFSSCTINVAGCTLTVSVAVPIKTGPIYEEPPGSGKFFDPIGPLSGALNFANNPPPTCPLPATVGFSGTLIGSWVNGNPSTVVFNGTPGITLANGDAVSLTGTITVTGPKGDERITQGP